MFRNVLAVGAVAVGVMLATSQQVQAAPVDAHHAHGSTNMFWFMHISDTHIGSFRASGINDRFRKAIEISKVVNPWFLLATGDLVEGGRGLGIPTTGQSDKEWSVYQQLYEEAEMRPDFYFDLPGNHDGYGDVGMTFYKKWALQGKTHNSSSVLSWVVDIPLGSYLFFGWNSAGNGSGPISEKPAFLDSEIAKVKDILARNPDARLNFFSSHHHLSGKDEPFGPVPTNASKVIELMESLGGAYYLHGHKHRCGEYLLGERSVLVNQIGSLGLPVHKPPDEWMNIGIAVVDHDGFTYRVTDVEKPFPLVIVTTPVGMDLRGEGELGDQSPEGMFHPYVYKVCKDRTDNPVRALVFGQKPPTRVEVKVGSLSPVQMQVSAVAPQIWEGKVDTTSLSPGNTHFTVVATFPEDGGGEQVAEHRVRVALSSGPCAELPVDPPPGTGGGGGAGGTGGAGGEAGAGGDAGAGGGAGAGGDAGAGGEAGAGAGGSGGEASGGYGAGGGQGGGGQGASAGNVDSGTAPDGNSWIDGEPDDDSGCACEISQTSRSAQKSSAAASLLALLGLGIVWRRRRG